MNEQEDILAEYQLRLEENSLANQFYNSPNFIDSILIFLCSLLGALLAILGLIW